MKLSDFLKNLPKNRLIRVDNWNILHSEFLENIGFKSNPKSMDLDNPRMTIVYIKGKGFVLVDMVKKSYNIFPKFDDLSNHLMNYKQKWQDAPYTKSGNEI